MPHPIDTNTFATDAQLKDLQMSAQLRAELRLTNPFTEAEHRIIAELARRTLRERERSRITSCERGRRYRARKAQRGSCST